MTENKEKRGYSPYIINDDNVKLKKHQIELENFYKHLLDSESCGLMAYTYPEHKMIHLNKKAREIYNISEDELNCTNKLFEIAKDTYMPDPETIIKLYRLKNYDGSVDYTEVLNYGKENEKEVIARTTSFLNDNKRVLITTLIDTSKHLTGESHEKQFAKTEVSRKVPARISIGTISKWFCVGIGARNRLSSRHS